MNLRECSNRNFAITGDRGTHEEIRTGCLQRIADATDIMARRFRDLQEERDRYQQWHDQEVERRLRAERSNSALRGQITKLRKRLAAQEARP